MSFHYLFIPLLCLNLSLAATAQAGPSSTIQVAVASNFQATLQRLVADFEATHPQQVRISSGSSGKLYTQIVHGAPYDLFLSADSERPKLLHEQGLADPPVTYAIGQLVLYAPAGTPLARLERGDFRHLAIANPTTAPYGAAARSVLQELKQWEKVQSRLVQGENIGQTFQFVYSGNAQLGFVALAQIRALAIPATQYWNVPSDTHAALQQDAVLLRRSQVTDAARTFLRYLSSASARAIIAEAGYALP